MLFLINAICRAPNYDLLVKKKLFSSLQDILRFLDIVQQELTVNLIDRNLID